MNARSGWSTGMAWIAICFHLSGSVSAQPDSSEVPTLDESVLERAESHYESGRWSDALHGYEAAYHASNDPDLLLRIASCHSRLQNLSDEVNALQTYLQESPNSEDRSALEDRIAELISTIEQREEAARNDRRAALERRVLEAENRAQQALLQLEEEQQARREAGQVLEQWWFWAIVGGAAVVVAGTVGGFLLANDEDELPSGSLGVLDRR